MSYDVQLNGTSQKSITSLEKKYPHVKNDLLGYIKALEEKPSAGDPMPGWNREIWNVRVASSDGSCSAPAGDLPRSLRDNGETADPASGAPAVHFLDLEVPSRVGKEKACDKSLVIGADLLRADGNARAVEVLRYRDHV